MHITSAKIDQVTSTPGLWVYVDIGFSSKQRSCGLLIEGGDPVELLFSELCERLKKLCKECTTPINLVIEAPLSVAFDSKGNPAGRSIERLGKQTRYWYVGLGCSVLVAATYLLRELVAVQTSTQIYLIEGMVSFKDKSVKSSHSSDVLALQSVVRDRKNGRGYIVTPNELKQVEDHTLKSAFQVAGMDFGIPPVIVATLI